MRNFIKKCLLGTSLIGLSMCPLVQADIVRTVKGVYGCEMIFNYKTDGGSTISREHTFKKKSTVNTSSFFENTFGSTITSKKNKNLNAKVSYGAATVNGSVSSSLHNEVANTLTSRNTSSENIEEEEVVTVQYELKPNSKMNLYRLTYSANGVTILTDSVTTDKNDCTGTVDIEYRLSGSCLAVGFEKKDVLYRFLPTPTGNRPAGAEYFHGQHAGKLIAGVQLNSYDEYRTYIYAEVGGSSLENGQIVYGDWKKGGRKSVLKRSLKTNFPPSYEHTYSARVTEVADEKCGL